MLRGTLPTALVLVLALGLLPAATVSAGQWLGVAGRAPQGRPPHYAGNPMGSSAGPPAPHRYPEYNIYYPWYGYGFGVPTYNWGHFGARWRPASIRHTGYYGDYMQWGYRRGY